MKLSPQVLPFQSKPQFEGTELMRVVKGHFQLLIGPETLQTALAPEQVSIVVTLIVMAEA